MDPGIIAAIITGSFGLIGIVVQNQVHFYLLNKRLDDKADKDVLEEHVKYHPGPAKLRSDP